MPPAILAASRLYVIPVALVAVALYVTVATPWQRTEVIFVKNTGVPTAAVMLTVCTALVLLLQPFAVAVIIKVPDHPAAKVTSPVEVLMLLPPEILAASRLYVIPVLLVAVALYVTVATPWQRVELAPDAKTGVLTSGITIIVVLPAPLLQPSDILFCDLT